MFAPLDPEARIRRLREDPREHPRAHRRRPRLRGAARGRERLPVKDTPPEQLVEAIHVVAHGDALLSPTITRRVIEEFVPRPPDSVRSVPDPVGELTPRELDAPFHRRGPLER
jgi:hypothetical protein